MAFVAVAAFVADVAGNWVALARSLCRSKGGEERDIAMLILLMKNMIFASKYAICQGVGHLRWRRRKM